MTDAYYAGNAHEDAGVYRGWLLGHFLPEAAGVRASGDIEVKWGIHPAGQRRDAHVTGEKRTTLLLLIRGRFRLDLAAAGSVLLAREGDYVVWGVGVDHSWHAEEDSVVVTVRWPSLPD